MTAFKEIISVKASCFKYSVTVLFIRWAKVHLCKKEKWKDTFRAVRSLMFFIPAGVVFSPACQAQRSIKISFFTFSLPPPNVWLLPFLKTQHFKGVKKSI